MKMTTTIFALLIVHVIHGQGNHLKLSLSSSIADITDPAVLSNQLTTGLQSDKKKVEAIFYWITDNISYQARMPRTLKRKNNKHSFFIEEENNDALPSLTERIAVKVLMQKQAVCEGYARLFKSLCDHAGIPAVIITGYARADGSRAENKFRSNHAWNAVYFDSAWHLLDATWASGYITIPSGDFVKKYDGYYFLTAPEKFIRHHFPDDLQWTLLQEPPAIAEFKNTAFRQRSFGKYFITSFYPAAGIIEAAIGDTINLEIQVDAMRQQMVIAPDSLWDATVLNYAPSFAYVQPATTVNNKILYRFPVSSADVQWLHVMYNDDAVLRYRLAIKKSLKE